MYASAAESRRNPMTVLRSARRATIGLLVATLFATSVFTQDGYRTPPDAITKILDLPSAPAVSVSSDRKWLLITTADVPETSIAELAEPTLFLAGRRFQTQPRYRIDFEGVRTASIKPVAGGAEIPIPVPNGARLTSLTWSRDATKLAYFVMTPERMTLHIFDLAAKSSRAVSASNLEGRLESSGGWSRDGKHFLFSATTREEKRCGSPTLPRLRRSGSRHRRSTTWRVAVRGRPGVLRRCACCFLKAGVRNRRRLKRRPARSCRSRTAAPSRRVPTPTC